MYSIKPAPPKPSNQIPRRISCPRATSMTGAPGMERPENCCWTTYIQPFFLPEKLEKKCCYGPYLWNYMHIYIYIYSTYFYIFTHIYTYIRIKAIISLNTRECPEKNGPPCSQSAQDSSSEKFLLVECPGWYCHVLSKSIVMYCPGWYCPYL